MSVLPAGLPTHLEALRAAVEAALGVDWTVIHGDQDAPAPTYPYATVALLSAPDGIGRPELALIDGGSTVTIRSESDAEFEASIQLFARADDPSTDPAVIGAAAVRGYLFHPAAREALGVAGVVVVDGQHPRKVPIIAGAKWERRAALDVRCRTRLQTDVVSDAWIDPASVQHIHVLPGVSGTIGSGT